MSLGRWLDHLSPDEARAAAQKVRAALKGDRDPRSRPTDCHRLSMHNLRGDLERVAAFLLEKARAGGETPWGEVEAASRVEMRRAREYRQRDA